MNRHIISCLQHCFRHILCVLFDVHIFKFSIRNLLKTLLLAKRSERKGGNYCLIKNVIYRHRFIHVHIKNAFPIFLRLQFWGLIHEIT